MTVYAVVIPAYNEAATLRDIVTRTLNFCQNIIVVDDGSVDATLKAIQGLPVTVLRHATNQGKAASLWDGMQAALQLNVDAAVTLDADGQHAPEDIPRLMEAASHHPQKLIIGARKGDPASIPKSRYYANKIANFWLSWASGQRLQDSQSGFRLYPAKLCERIAVPHGKTRSFVFESEVLIEAARMGFYTQAVSIPAVYKAGARPSHYRHRDSLRITLMVAWKLLSRGFFLPGFYRAFIK